MKKQTHRFRYRYRSAINGYFVTAKYAQKHPRTTVAESVVYRFKRGVGFRIVRGAK